MLSAVIALAGVTATAALAQQGRTELRGTVTDEQGGVLPGVTVVLAEQSTGFTREVVSSGDGSFFAAQMLIGVYTITATLPGFATMERTDYDLRIGQTSTLPIVLPVGGVEETITVSGQSPLVDLTSAEVGGTINTDELVDLPLVNRSAFAAIAMLPGVQFNPSTSQGNDGIIANGQTTASSTLNTDGAINSDSTGGGGGGSQVKVALESVAEFQVITNQFDAEFGRASGAIINAVTKRGTNQFTGAGFSYSTTTAMTATNFLTKQTGADKPENSKYEFGGVLGGPIVTDAAHFFVSLERRLTNPGRTKIFNSRPDFTRTTTENWRAWNYMIRADHQINANHSWAVRWIRELSPEKDVYASTLRTLPATSRNEDDEQMVVGTYTSVLGNNKVNTFRAMNSVERFCGSATQFVDAGGCETRSGVHRNLPPGYYTSSFQDIIDTTSGGRDDFQFQFTDTMSIFVPDMMGDHDFKFGGSWYHNKIEDFREDHLGGEFRFNSTDPFNIDDPFTYPDRLQIRVGDPLGREFDYPMDGIDLFFQDKWSVTDRLTVGLGVRYDAEMLKGRLEDNPLLTPGTDPRDWNNISPRLSIAYDVAGDGRSVIRGGYGVFYDKTLLSGLDNVAHDPATQTSFAVTFPRGFARDSGPRNGLPATDPELLAATIVVAPGDPLFSSCPPETSSVQRNGCVLVNHDYIAASFPQGRVVNQDRVYLDNSNRVMPWFHQFTVGYERELAGSLSVSVDYVRMRGRDLLNRINYIAGIRPDQTDSSTLTYYDVGSAPGLGGNVEGRNDTVFYQPGPFTPSLPGFGAVGFNQAGTFVNRVLSIESVGESQYDALNFAFEKRYSNRWGARVVYAYGSSRGDTFEQYGTNGPSLNGTQTQVLGNLNLAENIQPSETDRRHILTLSARTEFPGGITASAILRWMTELPFTIYNDEIDINQNGSLWDPLPPGIYSGDPADANPITREQTRGNCELINAVGCQAAARAADYLQLDVRFGYRMRPRVTQTVDIYFDIINMTDRVNWNVPTGNQDSGNFLNYTVLRGGGFPRQANFGLRYGF